MNGFLMIRLLNVNDLIGCWATLAIATRRTLDMLIILGLI